MRVSNCFLGQLVTLPGEQDPIVWMIKKIDTAGARVWLIAANTETDPLGWVQSDEVKPYLIF